MNVSGLTDSQIAQQVAEEVGADVTKRLLNPIGYAKAGTWTLKLKPCPFCENNEIKTVEDVAEGRLPNVWCPRCGAEGPEASTLTDAVNAWNSRPFQKGVPLGAKVEHSDFDYGEGVVFRIEHIFEMDEKTGVESDFTLYGVKFPKRKRAMYVEYDDLRWRGKL